MKKLYFIALSFFAGLTITNGQVVLTQSNHAPAAGDSYVMYQIDSTGITPGASGSSAVWNFTATPSRTTIALTNSCSPSTNTMYPAGSVARTTGTSSANYYTSTSSQLNFWGGHIQVSIVNADYVFSTPAIQASYPMVYSTSVTSTFTGNITSGSNNGTLSNGTCTTVVDGQGMLNLPMRSLNSVIRVNTYTGFDFSIMITPFTAVGNVKQQTWDYYSPLKDFPSTKLNPMFTIQASTITVTSPTNIVQTSTIVLLNKDYQFVGITENSKEVVELNMFPNPASGNFNLVFVNENASDVTVEITNAIGQVVKKETKPSEKGVVNHSFDITDIKAGVYFVKINVGNKSSIRKLTIQ